MKRLTTAFALLAAALAAPQDHAFVACGESNGIGTVNLHDHATGTFRRSFLAYGTGFSGGVHVAAGDVNGDGFADVVTGPGPGGGPHVKVFDGNTGALIHSFFAYPPGYMGGVAVGVGDLNGDGFGDIITGTAGGTQAHVKAFSGLNGVAIASFFAFPGYTGGVWVAGSERGPGKAREIIAGSDSLVSAFALNGTHRTSFYPYGGGFTGGVRVAAGDVNGDGVDDIITGVGSGAPPHVKVFDGITNATLASFFAFGPGFTGGVSVGAGDFTGGEADGKDDIYAGTAFSSGTVCAFDGATFKYAFQPFGAGHNGGIQLDHGQVKMGYGLDIQSYNPASGVPMKVWTPDMNGLADGSTRMTRLYPPGTTVAVTAPLNVGNQWFDHWERDGSVVPGGSRTLSTLVNAYRIIRAIYLAARILYVFASGPAAAVPIKVWTADKNGLKDGVTDFSRTYTQGTTVSLTAPPLVGSNYFLRWDLEGNPWQAAKTVSLLMGGSNRTLTAVYAAGYLVNVLANQANVLIKVWTKDKAGMGDGTTNFQRLYAPGTNAAFTAPPSINSIPFKRWIIDGTPAQDSKRTITVLMSTPRIIEAEYE